MIQMEFNIWAYPRRAFCWLNEEDVVVVSSNEFPDKGHCEILNTVSLDKLQI